MFWREEISPDSGPHKILLKKGELSDEARGGRNVPYKIYHPDLSSAFPAQAGNLKSTGEDPRFHGESNEEMKFPVILWSHGFGGNRDGASFLSRYLAAQGYAVVHMTHPGTDSSLWENRPDVHPWDVLRNIDVPREVTLARFADIPFVLDMLERWQEEGGEIARTMDLSRIGMSGHSFGALTTQVMAGQRFPGEDGKLVRFPEKRFKSGIVYSPVPIGHLTAEGNEKEIYGSIDMPLFYMTGTDDVSPLGGFGYERRLVIFENSGHPEKYLLVKKGGDHMVYNGTRGKLKDNPLRERHEDIIRIGAHAFWDATLKDDEKARAWLSGGGFADYLGSDGEFISS